MTKEEIDKLENGIYNVWWKDGTCSVASIGSFGPLWDNIRWIAPVNRHEIYYGISYDEIDCVEKIPLLIGENGLCLANLKDNII
jgi:hypothetical protein